MEQGHRCTNTIGAICNPDQAWCANNVLRIFFCVRSAITIGAGGIGVPIVLVDYKEDDCVRCTSPIFIPIAYQLSFTNRKWKYCMLPKRRWLHKKINRHRLPRSGTTFEHLPDSQPPHFSLVTTFKLIFSQLKYWLVYWIFNYILDYLIRMYNVHCYKAWRDFPLPRPGAADSFRT